MTGSNAGTYGFFSVTSSKLPWLDDDVVEIEPVVVSFHGRSLVTEHAPEVIVVVMLPDSFPGPVRVTVTDVPDGTLDAVQR